MKMVREDEVSKKQEEVTLWRAKTQILATLSVSWISLIIGYSVAYANTADIFLEQDIPWIELQMLMVEKCLVAGAIFGAFVGGILMVILGRKWSLLFANFILLVSWVGFCLSKYVVNCLKFARFGIGVGVGIGCLVTPIYIAEISHPKLRGVLGMVPFVMGNVGFLWCYLLAIVLQWQDLALIAVFLCVPYFSADFYFVPESPVWYLFKHRKEASYKTLIGLRPSQTNNEKEYLDLEDYVTHRIKTFRHTLLPFLTIITLLFFQQLSFIYPFTYKFTKICAAPSFSVNPRICTIILITANLIPTFLALLLVDKLGRRILLYISIITMLISLTIFIVYFYFKNIHYNDWLLLVVLLVYILGFSLGLGTIPWLLMGEILHRQEKVLAAVLLTSSYWILSSDVTEDYLVRTEFWDIYCFYLIYIGLITLIILLKVCVPETKGKSLLDIQILLAKIE